MKHTVSTLVLSLLILVLTGCGERKAADDTPPVTSDARTLFEAVTKEYLLPSAVARGPERERLQEEAARRYAGLVKQFPAQSNLCAQALRNIANIRAVQTNVDAATRHYRQVGQEYPTERWEVLQAWKSAGDLLWENGRREDAKRFYADITNRFGADEPSIIRTVVRGSLSRLRE